MAKSLVSHVIDLTKSGTAFTDSEFADVGANAFSFRELKEDLGHDFFTQEDLIIRTASGGGGTLLVETTDYTLSEEDTLLSTEVTAAIGDARHVYKKIQIINASYQTGSLYVSGKWIADGIDASYFNAIAPIVVTKAVSYTITDSDLYRCYMVTTGAATKTITLPTVADNKHLRIKIVKADSGYGPVLVDGESAETINGLTHIFLWSQYDCIEVMSTGSEWIIINDFKPYFYSGWISRSDWTNVHIGFATITYDTLVGTVQVGDKVTGANGSYGIVIYDNGATSCVIANCVTVGATVFANNEVLTFDLSGATAAVDMASGLKNVDSNVYHGWGINARSVLNTLTISTDATETSVYQVDKFVGAEGASRFGHNVLGVDTNNIQMQTATEGLMVITSNGSSLTIDSEDYFYNIYIQLLSR